MDVCVAGLRTEGIFRRSVRVQIITDVQKLYNQGERGLHAPPAGAEQNQVLILKRERLRSSPDVKLYFETGCESCRRSESIHIELKVFSWTELDQDQMLV